ncbi:MAG: Oligopeptide ABC transporter, periplasmic oligopeptide-binding protein OppA [uncultured Thermomicrobiales bacterium]|uniref:Oligopeptide ABC transporter, periplasmic oligopeptide-binding protein OppA n=1 Tax=uncultured Thermomicrobiales bacterium TaxID=1645740 RepID=A0A6J4VX11_9BACT|nr:MAG: Oligopeptide ABC transporter, periplasmic oligopeptide-binding protein OppA [uncultured Thermomicrobiales bacterium]
MADHEPLYSLAADLTTGRLSRRAFIRRAAALGLSASAIGAVLAACGGATTTPTSAPVVPTATRAAAASTAPSVAPSAAPSAAASASPAASAAALATRPATAAASTAPASATAGAATGPTKRGGGGQLKLLWWQSPVVLNPHLIQGQKDTDASRPVYEPLATIGGDGKYVPILAAEIPSRENGGLSQDGKTVTWKLKSGVKWSDGTPFTAKDVAFTYQFIADPKSAATTIGSYKTIDKVEAIDDTTVKITFKAPEAAWFLPFVNQNGLILPQHIFKDGIGEPAKNFPANLKPVGTGPYKVTDFKPGDTVTYTINENYRNANGPFFDTVQVKGGGDAPSAARAVLQTGDYDYAWNLQVDAAVLTQLETGGKGIVAANNGSSTERILINFSDPNKEVDGQRSEKNTPHPFQTDKSVRNAYALACDKKSIVDTIYGKSGAIGNNVLYNPPQYNSPNTKSEYDLAKANALLDAAGWAKSGQYRAKGGVPMKITYSTTVNAVRQKTQQVVKDGLEKIGVQVELKSVDASVFFAPGSGGNVDSASLFYNDIEMYTNGNSSPDPFSYMEGLTTAQIAQKSNSWSGNNYTRWSNKEYDAVIEQLKTELDPAKRAELFIKANDIEINDFAEIPLVARKNVSGISKTLEVGQYTPWDSELWNIGNWVRK